MDREERVPQGLDFNVTAGFQPALPQRRTGNAIGYSRTLLLEKWMRDGSSSVSMISTTGFWPGATLVIEIRFTFTDQGCWFEARAGAQPSLRKRISAASSSAVKRGHGMLLTFPETTIAADTMIDDLTNGLTVVAGTPQVISTAAASGGLLAADFNGTIGAQVITPVAGNGGSVQFDFTNVVVAADSNATNNSILLRFRAVVVDDPANVSGAILSNNATNQVGAGPLVSSNTVTVTVVEPQIALSKIIVSLPMPAELLGEPGAARSAEEKRAGDRHDVRACAATAFDAPQIPAVRRRGRRRIGNPAARGR